MDDLENVWTELVEGDESTEVDVDQKPTEGRDKLPSALDGTELLNRLEVDSTEPTKNPDFLER